MNVSTREVAKNGTQSYFPQLDGLRAVSITLILIYHWLKPSLPLNIGHLGVSLFFVLSGFLITATLLNCRTTKSRTLAEQWPQIKEFYMRRVIRTFPLYYATLAAACLAGFTIARETWPWHALHISNVLLALYPGDLGLVAHFWALSVEEQFYLLWPWLIIFLPVGRMAATFAAFVIAGPLFRFAAYVAFPQTALAGLPLGTFDLLAAGGMLAYWKWNRRQQDLPTDDVPRFFGPAALVAFGLFIAVSFASEPQVQANSVWLNPLRAVFLAWIILKAMNGIRGFIGKFLQHPGVVYVGKISFGFYLLHPFVPILLSVICNRFPALDPLRHNPLLRFPACFLLTACVSALSWELFEKPIIRARSMFATARAARAAKSQIPENLAKLG